MTMLSFVKFQPVPVLSNISLLSLSLSGNYALKFSSVTVQQQPQQQHHQQQVCICVSMLPNETASASGGVVLVRSSIAYMNYFNVHNPLIFALVPTFHGNQGHSELTLAI